MVCDITSYMYNSKIMNLWYVILHHTCTTVKYEPVVCDITSYMYNSKI